MKIIVIILCIFVLYSCTHKQTEVTHRVFNINPDEAEEIPLSDWISHIELIPLETTKESAFAVCYKAVISDSIISVFDVFSHQVFTFDENGMFLFSTKEKKGRGPGECNAITDFNIENGNIVVLDAPDKKLVTYNQQGVFQKVHFINKVMAPLHNFNFLSPDTCIFDSYNDRNELAFYSMGSKNIFKRIGKHYDNYAFSTKKSCFYSLDDSLFFQHTFPSNIIYTIDKNNLELVQRLKFDFGKYNLIYEDLPKNEDKEFYLDFFRDQKNAKLLCVNENKKYMFVYFKLNKNIYTVRYSKISGNSDMRVHTKNTAMLPPGHVIDSEYLYRVEQFEHIKSMLAVDLLTDSSKKIYHNLSISDNPILIKYKLK